MEFKKVTTFAVLAANIILTFASFSVMSLFAVSKWLGVGIGTGILLISAILCISIKRKFYPVAIIVNGLAVGIAVSSLFVHLGQFPPVWQTAVAAIGTIILFAVFCLMTEIPFIYKHFVIFSCPYFAVLLAAEITCAVLVSPLSFYFALFLLLPFAAYLFVLGSKQKDKNELYKHLAVGSFSVLIIAIVIVIAVLTEGEILDGLAPDAPSSKKKSALVSAKKKKK